MGFACVRMWVLCVGTTLKLGFLPPPVLRPVRWDALGLFIHHKATTSPYPTPAATIEDPVSSGADALHVRKQRIQGANSGDVPPSAHCVFPPPKTLCCKQSFLSQFCKVEFFLTGRFRRPGLGPPPPSQGRSLVKGRNARVLV